MDKKIIIILGFVLTAQIAFAVDDRQVCGVKRKCPAVTHEYDAQETAKLKLLWQAMREECQKKNKYTINRPSKHQWIQIRGPVMEHVRHGADPEARQSILDLTLLSTASDQQDYEVCECLLSHGADANLGDSYGGFPVLQVNDLDLVDLFTKYGANLEPERGTQSILHRTAGYKNAEWTAYCINLGCNPDAREYVYRNTSLQTLLQHTWDPSQTDAVETCAKVFLLAETDIDKRNNHGQTARQFMTEGSPYNFTLGVSVSCNPKSNPALSARLMAFHAAVPAKQLVRKKPVKNLLTARLSALPAELVLGYAGPTCPAITVEEVQERS